MKLQSMKFNLTWFLTFLLVASVLGGCKVYEPEFRDVSSMKKQEGTPKGEVAYDLNVRVYNPNKFRIVLKRYDLEFYLNGKSVGTARSSTKNKLPGMKESNVTLSVYTTPTKLATTVLMMGLTGVLNGGEFKVKVKGSARARALLIGKTFLVDYEDGVDLNLDEYLK